MKIEVEIMQRPISVIRKIPFKKIFFKFLFDIWSKYCIATSIAYYSRQIIIARKKKSELELNYIGKDPICKFNQEIELNLTSTHKFSLNDGRKLFRFLRQFIHRFKYQLIWWQSKYWRIRLPLKMVNDDWVSLSMMHSRMTKTFCVEI